MALRAGELMVVIRAQDFASRTLRRVGAEMEGLSRAQMIQFRGEQVAMQKQAALQRVAMAESQRRRLEWVKEGTRLRKLYTERGYLLNDLTDRTKAYQAAQERLNKALGKQRRDATTGRFRPMTAKQKAELSAAKQQFVPAAKAVNDSRIAMEKFNQSTRGMDWSRVNRHVTNFNNKIGQMPRVLQMAAQSQRALGDAIYSNRAQLQNAYNGLTRAQQAALAFEQALEQMPLANLDRMAHAISGIGRTMQLFGAVGTVALGAAASKAADFNTQMSLAATQARDLNAPASQVNQRIEDMTNGFFKNGQEIDGVLDLMNKYPANADAMAKATYDIFSSMNTLEKDGIVDVAAGMKLLEDANKLAVAGGVELAEGTNAMITVLNNFDPKLRNTSAQFDTMFDIVRFGRMTMEDFNVMMNKVAPAAADAGNALEDVGGAMAFLTTVMPSQRMVATGISRLMEALRRPDMIEGLKKFGVEVEDATGKMRPMDELLKDIAAHFPELRTGQMNAAEFFQMVSSIGRGGNSRGVIFTQEGRRALSQIMTHFGQYAEAQRRIEQNNGEFSRSLQAQMASLGVAWDRFMNRVRAVVIAVGTDAIPVFAELGDVLGRLLDWWNSLDSEIRGNIVRFMVMSSVASLLGGIFLAVLGSMMAFEAMLRKLVGSGSGAAGMMRNIWIFARRLAAIGIISLIIKVSIKGPPGAKDLLMAAIMGGMLGKGRLGKGMLGAARGSIIIPVTLMITGGSFDDITKQWNDKLRGWARGIDKNLPGPLGDFIAGGVKGIADLDDKMQGFNKTAEKSKAKSPLNMKILRDWRTALNDRTADTPFEKDIAAWEKYRKAMRDFPKKLKEYSKAYGEYKQDLEQYNRDMEQWNEQLQQTIVNSTNSTVDNLRNMYIQMQDANKQAFGELFKGPWLTSETFDLAKEWGITPGIQDMIRDLDEQNVRFRQWRNSIDKALKKGVPRDFINEIRQMGPEEGQHFLDNMINAKPGQLQNLINKWKLRNKQIQSQTKMDFTDEIARFKKAGLDMGQAIVEGFNNAAVGKWFDTWIKSTFPEVIDAAVASAVAEWKAANPKPVAPKAPTEPKPPKPPTSTTTTSNDYSRTFNVKVGDFALPIGVGFNAQLDIERRAAFIANSVLRGIN